NGRYRTSRELVRDPSPGLGAGPGVLRERARLQAVGARARTAEDGVVPHAAGRSRCDGLAGAARGVHALPPRDAGVLERGRHRTSARARRSPRGPGALAEEEHWRVRVRRTFRGLGGKPRRLALDALMRGRARGSQLSGPSVSSKLRLSSPNICSTSRSWLSWSSLGSDGGLATPSFLPIASKNLRVYVACRSVWSASCSVNSCRSSLLRRLRCRPIRIKVEMSGPAAEVSVARNM